MIVLKVIETHKVGWWNSFKKKGLKNEEEENIVMHDASSVFCINI